MTKYKMTVENWSESTREIKHRPKTVLDRFAFCEQCKKWIRLLPVDETGFRTIPVTRNHIGHKWICWDCWDLEDLEFDKMFED